MLDSDTLKLVAQFLVHMVVGAILFAVVACVAFMLWLGTQWLREKGAPDSLFCGAWALTELLFWLDVLLFGGFVIAESIKLARAIKASIR